MSALVYASGIILHVLNGARCQGTATMELSRNPVYSGELVVLSCRYGEENTLSFVTIDAFNHTRKEGYLWCRVPKQNVTSYGVISGNVSGCPYVSGSTNVNITMTALPSLELDFNCTVIVTNVDTKQYTLTSAAASLVVNVLPSAPKLAAYPLEFYENDEANIVCESHNGKPASAVILTVSSLNGSRLAASGIGSASLSLSAPLINWHNATATCNVENHNFSNMTTSSSILIKQSFFGDEKPSEIHEIAYVPILTSVIIIVMVATSILTYCMRKILLARKERLIDLRQGSSKSYTLTDDEREMVVMVDNDLYSVMRTHQSNDSEQHLRDKATAVEDLCSEPPQLEICDAEHHYEEVSRYYSTLQYSSSTSNDMQAKVKVKPVRA